MKSFLFVGHFVFFLGKAIHELKILTNVFIHFTDFAYNLKSKNSSVCEHVNRHQTTKFHANEIK